MVDKWFSLVQVDGRSNVSVATKNGGNYSRNSTTTSSAASTTATIEIDPQRLEKHILKRLEELQRHQENSQEDERYNIFYLDGFIEGDALIMSSNVASAVIRFLQQEAAASRDCCWKTLHIETCRVNEAFLEVLDVAKTLGLFPELRMEVMRYDNDDGDNDHNNARIIERFCRNNPSLTHLRLNGFDTNNFDNLSLDRACTFQLRHILDTTISSSSTSDSHCLTTRLKTLVLYTAEVDLECWEHIAEGLKMNDSLEELQLRQLNIDHGAVRFSNDGLPPFLMDSLCGHANLRALELEGNHFTPKAFLSLGSVMRDPACRIASLSLDKCMSITTTGGDHGQSTTSLRKDLVAVALEGSQSLQCLYLRNCEQDQENLRRILDLVDTCPVLREINLFRCKATGPFWISPSEASNQQHQSIRSYSPVLDETRNTRKSLHRLILTGNTVIRGDGDYSISRYDEALQELLLRYPGLGELNYLKEDRYRRSYYATFSMRTNQLLAWNYASRGNLLGDQTIPLSLWLHVLYDRVDYGTVSNGAYFLSDLNFHDNLHKLKESCRASILFCLLRQQPTQVTLAACAT